jgi:hypothetical protein
VHHNAMVFFATFCCVATFIFMMARNIFYFNRRSDLLSCNGNSHGPIYVMVSDSSVELMLYEFLHLNFGNSFPL